MKFGQECRHKGALESRKADVDLYTMLLKSSPYRTLRGKTYASKEEYNSVVSRKLKLAKADVEKLTELCSAYEV